MLFCRNSGLVDPDDHSSILRIILVESPRQTPRGETDNVEQLEIGGQKLRTGCKREYSRNLKQKITLLKRFAGRGSDLSCFITAYRVYFSLKMAVKLCRSSLPRFGRAAERGQGREMALIYL
jgi:hypothetical protein